MSSTISNSTGGTSPEAPVERWYLAATRVCPAGSDELQKWTNRTVEEALSFTRQNVYLHGLAVMSLALLEETSWIPSLAYEEK